MALLAASPSGDALGWDARARGGSFLAVHLEPSGLYAPALARRVVAVAPEGTVREVPVGRDEHGYRPQIEWAVVWCVAGVDRPFDRMRLRAYIDRQRSAPWVAAAIGDARVVRFFRAYRSVVPERWREPPVRRTLLDERTLMP